MIRTDDEGPLRIVTLARPDRRNALTPDALDRLRRAVQGADAPVVYIRGAGDAFCAGADLEVVADLDAAGAEALARRGQRAAAAIEAADSVVVAGIDGAARGGGVELALACDLRVATPAATLAEPGVTFGLFGAWGGTVRLPRVVGLGDALDLALSGRVVDADEARRMGLVSRVVEDPRAVAESIADNDPGALAVVKERVRDRASPVVQQSREARSFAALVDERREEP